MDELQKARARIDEIDAQLAELFVQRMEAAAQIAAWKKDRGLPVRDPAREAEVLAKNEARIADPALRPWYRGVQEALFAASREYQTALQAREEQPAPAPEPAPAPAPQPGAAGGGKKRIIRCDALSPLLTVRTAAGAYNVYLRAGALRRAGEILPREGRTFVVTDDGVPAEYARAVAGHAPRAAVYTLPRGEGSKSPAVLTDLLEAMQTAGLTRSDRVAAVGGGVVGDLAGLAAALYMRGIDWYYFPTTVLAMADASVGGKTAVDLGGVKNAVGAFWPPKAVVIDPRVLDTLPPRQYSNGLAEAVKMALTHDPELFARFEDPAGCGPIEDVLISCLRIKASVVEADEREGNLRRVLNLGHTLGHGLEAAAGGALLHGEAVALGMIPVCAPEVRARLIPVLRRLGLPTYVNFELDPEAVLAAVSHDKKSADGGITLVTVPAVGAFAFRRAGLPELRQMLAMITEEQR